MEAIESDSCRDEQRGAGEKLLLSFFLAGFECSTHYNPHRRRLDLIDATQHEDYCYEDYQRLAEIGIRVCREGLRWHRIETEPGEYNWESVLPMLKASRDTGVQIIWDLFHFGWPDDLDIFTPEFVERFCGFAEAFGKLLQHWGENVPVIVPVNEPSFMAWGGGDVAYINPFCLGRGLELKVQLARASLEAMKVLRRINLSTRFIHVDPIIHVAADPNHPEDVAECESYSNSHFQAWDMLCGREWPQVGGSEEDLDLIGVNFYPKNEWVHKPHRILHPSEELYRPLRMLLQDIWERYRKPIIITETGTEGCDRGLWLDYVSNEVAAAHEEGVPVGGICLYPIVNHPGWDDERHCPNGLWGYPDKHGNREIEMDLAPALQRAQERFERLGAGRVNRRSTPSRDGSSNGVMREHTAKRD